MAYSEDHALVECLRREDNASFAQLYARYFPSVAGYIQQNKGSLQDAEDLFQEAVIVLLHRIRQPEFTLSSSLHTFLYAIARNLWLKRLRDGKRLMIHTDAVPPAIEATLADIGADHTGEERIANWLSRITENCQRILKAIFFLNEPINVLMKRKGWKNRHTAANQQYKCIQQLKRGQLKP